MPIVCQNNGFDEFEDLVFILKDYHIEYVEKEIIRILEDYSMEELEKEARRLWNLLIQIFQWVIIEKNCIKS